MPSSRVATPEMADSCACGSPASACSPTFSGFPRAMLFASARCERRRASRTRTCSAGSEEVLQLNPSVLGGDVRQLDAESIPARLEPRRRAYRLESERVLAEERPRVVHDPWPVEC